MVFCLANYSFMCEPVRTIISYPQPGALQCEGFYSFQRTVSESITLEKSERWTRAMIHYEPDNLLCASTPYGTLCMT